jgi:hypothetical protein
MRPLKVPGTQGGALRRISTAYPFYYSFSYKITRQQSDRPFNIAHGTGMINFEHIDEQK